MTLLRKTLDPPAYGLRRATISSIIGEPGVGKSALAIHFTHTIRDTYPDAQLYRDLQQYVDPNVSVGPAQILRSFLRSLGKQPDELPDDQNDLRNEFRNVTDGKRLVIVLDNAVNYSQVEPLIPASPTCHVIVTSRERFSSLNLAPLVLMPLPVEASVDLFVYVAPSRAPKTPEEHEQLRQVLTACDGLPLAIRLLAARLEQMPNLSLARILDDLEHETGLSAAFGPGREELAASLRVSYKGLSPQEAMAFRRLGAVPGESFDRQLTAKLAEVDTSVAGVLLERLTNLQLLQATQNPDYFTMHSILRRFALEQLDSEGSGKTRLEIVGIILDYYVRNAAAASRSLQPESEKTDRQDLPSQAPDQGAALKWLTSEYRNLVAAIRRACVDGYADAAWHLCDALVGLFEIRNEWESWEETHKAVAAVLDGPDDLLGRAHILRGLGRLHRARRSWDGAVSYYRESVALFRQLERVQDVGMTLHALGDVYRYARNWDSASNCLSEALMILEEVGYRRGVAIAKRSIATIPRVRGDYEAAEALYHDAITILESVGDERWHAATTLSLADIYLDRRFPDAQPLLEKCLTVFNRLGDRHWRALTLRSLGEALRLNGCCPDALTRLGESLAILERRGDQLWQAQVLHSIGLVHLDCDEPARALEYFNAALAKFEATGDTLWEGRTYVSIGRAMSAIDAMAPGARDAYNKAWPLLVEQGAKADLKSLDALTADIPPRE
jgi:tetratricopeptide (TPR) repeat protein